MMKQLQPVLGIDPVNVNVNRYCLRPNQQVHRGQLLHAAESLQEAAPSPHRRARGHLQLPGVNPFKLFFDFADEEAKLCTSGLSLARFSSYRFELGLNK
jgi:hypothetical protein